MRLGDLDHLRQRAINEECNGNSIDLIDTEPTYVENESDMLIQWLPAKRERRTKDCHSISNGVECNRCRKFQTYPTRFCGDCGGKFNGELPIKNKYAERNARRFKTWHE
jgi:hypothetical protein